MSGKNEGCKWKSNPRNSSWDNKDNWEANIIPIKIATFSISCVTNIDFSEDCESQIEEIEFKEEAPSYNFNINIYRAKPALIINGLGVINNSKKPQRFSIASRGVGRKTPQLKFTNKASAGNYNMLYYAGPESLENGYGGGVISFADNTTAGSAFFTIRTGKRKPPSENSTVGAEVSFNDSSNAGNAKFTVFGTLGKDGDTFGNAVFHDKSSAENAIFTNIGGTVEGGDGGNTQFYDEASAAFGTYDNFGGNVKKANGGDVAFDGVATAGNGLFYNRAAKVEGAFGGVTSFNNNPNIFSNHPHITTEKGATAGNASFHNFGATANNLGGGGHTEFTAKYASCNAGNGNFYNYGSIINKRSSAGHTIFSISRPTKNYPSAGNGTFWNYPSPIKNGAGGFTEFSMYNEGSFIGLPTAEKAVFINLGATIKEANGGYTSFSNETTASESYLIAHGGINGGNGGRILFNDNSLGDQATIELIGNGELDLSYHVGDITFKNLKLSGGIIRIKLSNNPTSIKISNNLIINNSETFFSFYLDENDGINYNKPYAVMISKNMKDYNADLFKGSKIEGINPDFTILEDVLFVNYNK